MAHVFFRQVEAEVLSLAQGVRTLHAGLRNLAGAAPPEAPQKRGRDESPLRDRAKAETAKQGKVRCRARAGVLLARWQGTRSPPLRLSAATGSPAAPPALRWYACAAAVGPM